MSTSKSTLALFWRENMRYPKYFLGAGFSWIIGMSLQRLVLAIIVSKALNHLVAIYNQLALVARFF